MSTWLYPFERRVRWDKRRRLFIALIVGYFIVWLLDRVLFRALFVGRGINESDPLKRLTLYDDARRSFENKDWVETLRAAGYLPVWIAVGVALLLAFRPWRMISPTPAAARRAWGGLLVVVAAAIAGGLAEALKPLVGRLRPLFTEGRHIFRHVEGIPDERLSYGMASSHAGVAFGAAFALLFLYGPPGWVAIVVAAGCGLTRMMAGAHFATDVYVAAALGYAAARLLIPREREGLLLP